MAWEVLLDQDEREDVPTAASQYAIQKALEDPIAFAASCNPDILDRILTYGTLLDVLWLMYHTWITYGTVRRIA